MEISHNQFVVATTGVFYIDQCYIMGSMICRVKSGKIGQKAKFGQRPCLFHISNIGIKNRLAKQTVKILMRRLI